MEDKYKNMILWFSVLPIFVGMAAYGVSKEVNLAIIFFVAALPLGVGGAYYNYRKGSSSN